MNETNTYGRIISLTDDGYKAINVPAKSTDHTLVFEGTKVFLEYLVGKKKHRHNLTYQNMPILSGSKIIGSFDATSYDKAALAELFNVELEKVDDATHADIIRLLGSNAAVFFTNPFSKPPKGTKKTLPAYQEWERGEKDRWELAVILFCNDKPMRDIERKKTTPTQPKVENKPAVTEQPAGTEQPANTEQPAVTEEQAVEEAALQAAREAAADLFHNGLGNDGKGIVWAKMALNKKQINHEEFVAHCEAIIEESFMRGVDACEGILPPVVNPVIDYLNQLKERNNSAAAAMKLANASTPEIEQSTADSNAEIDALIANLVAVINE